MTVFRVVICALLLGSWGCVQSEDAEPSPDAAVDAAVDGSTPDAAQADAAVVDAAPLDGSVDAEIDAEIDAFIEPDVWVPPDAYIEPDAAPDMGPPVCDPPLSPERALFFARIFDLITLRVQGGSGRYHFELEDNQSGALLNPATGAYLAGERVGVDDRIRITDTECVGETFATVRVVEPLIVRPSVLQITPNSTFTFETEGGSGAVQFELLRQGSGPQLAANGTYSSGPNLGEDSVRVTDLETGQTIDAFVEVVESISLVARPPVIYLPVGSRHPLRIEGGSGHYDAVFDGEGAELVEDELAVVAPGQSVATLTDRFTGRQATVRVHAVAPLDYPHHRLGDGANSSGVIGPGDLNGDGFDDAVVASAEMDVNAVNSGALFVYAGSADGLGPEPVQVLAGFNRRDELGRSMVIEDFDGDGQKDLAVGVWLTDFAGGDSGSIQIHRGIEGGFFEEVPDQTLTGIRGGDQLGWAVTACDFNGDGRMDLAATALRYEDRDLEGDPTNQGAIFTFLGYEDGFLQRPDTITVGLVPDGEGGFMPLRELKVGWWLAAGDFNGDGRCDLAAHSLDYEAAPDGSGNDDGTVFVYRGEGPDELTNGGLSALPYAIFAGIEEGERNRQFGRRIAAADFNGDGRAELLAGHYRRDSGQGRDSGAAHIVVVGELDAPALEIQSAAVAAWTALGQSAYDNFGWHVSTSDATGDGIPDVLVGAWADELPGFEGDSGAVFLYEGQADGWPGAEPIQAWGGVARSDRVGESAAFVGDTNGDGIREVLAFAGRSDLHGPEVGSPYLFEFAQPVEPPEDPEAPVDPVAPVVGTPLMFPGEASGARFGSSVGILGDVDGDGVADVAVGAMWQGHAAYGVRAGAGYIFSGGIGEAQPISDYQFHSGYDQTGQGVGDAGDFDGDGFDDFALVAASEEQPSNVDGYARSGECGPRRNDAGAVFIFRGGPAFDLEPDFVYYGRRVSQQLRKFAGNVDINGDGFDDFVIGSVTTDIDDANDVGSAAIVFGEPADPDGGLKIICEPAYRFLGDTAGGHVGRSVAAVGDLDGDGCDEVAVGNSRETLGDLTRQGSVRVFFGWGGPGCPAQPEFVTLTTGEAIAENGWSVAAGDLDGDGVPEIVSGGPLHLSGGIRVGGIWVAEGGYVASLPRSRGTGPDGSAGFPYNEGEVVPMASGTVNGERFGVGLAVEDGILAVGATSGSYSGVPLVGSVHFFRGMDPEPIALFVGETWRAGGRTGESIDTGMIGGRLRLLVGGYDASGTSIDNGAAYLLDLGDL